MGRRTSNSRGVVTLIFCVLILAAAVPANSQTLNEDSLKGMKWRLVGPFRGGRALAVAGITGDPATYYFGAAAGGVWKTTDGGNQWLPIFDKEKIASIGAIAVAPSDPNVIYVGTGEACIRGDISYGDGVYKSTDAGKSWAHIGLDDTRHIGRVIIDPRNPDIVFVAALGHAYGPNADRGVFRSADGGKSWQKVLYQDDKTGAIDITFDPGNSHILFASLWQAGRTPWTLNSGGPGSGLYKSTDGGATWKKLEGHGLPKGTLGRIGVSVSGGDAHRVYAMIEAEEGGLYRSDDSGDTWQRATDDRRLRQRPWYFSHVFADPKSDDVVYVLNTGMYRSSDGGSSFTSISAPHGDRHGLWIDPANTSRMIESDDGGATITMDAGKSWTSEDNQPTAQFYHVATDSQFLYHIYGAQQDNSTVSIASRTDAGAITDKDWFYVAGGESGFVVPDPRNPNIVYAGSYDGEITRFDKSTGQAREISAWPLNPMGHGAAELVHRFQWTAPIALSPTDPDVLYHGAEVLFKSTNGGASWDAISPDLTRNDKSKQQSAGGPITQDNTSVEYYDTIFAVAESPLDKNLIWVGTDDGLVQVTRDAGKNWANVTPKDLADWSLISIIDPSTHDAGTAYVAVDRHRLDDFHPYIYKTTDYGKSWMKLVTGLPDTAYVHAVREDPARKGLLYAGTETGIYISFDDGAHWQSLQLNLPVVPVHDLTIHNDDLIVATHGRAFWLLDDISPIRQLDSKLDEKTTTEAARFFTPRLAYRSDIGGRPVRPGMPVGSNPPGGAILDYWLKDGPKEAEKPKDAKDKDSKEMKDAKDTKAAKDSMAPSADAKDKEKDKAKDAVTLVISDAQGKVIRKYSSSTPKHDSDDDDFGGGPAEEPIPAEKGLNRFTWDLQYESATKVPGLVTWGGSGEGPTVVPGKYEAKLTVAGKDYTVPIEVKEDPRITVSQADLEKQLDLALKIRGAISSEHEAVNQMNELNAQLAALRKRLGTDEKYKPILTAADDLSKKMKAVTDALVQLKSKVGEDPLNFPIQASDQMAALGSTVESADAAPTQQSYAVFDLLSKQNADQLAKWQALKEKDLPALNAQIAQANIPAISITPPKESSSK
jgi:photosystem II stability/assembly factor-like uncharacterized protein